MTFKARYFNGFTLHDEQILWQRLEPLEWHRANDVIGFNTGTLEAIKYTLANHTNVRRLSLLSPIILTNPKEHMQAFMADSCQYAKDFFNKMLQNTPQTKLIAFHNPQDLIDSISILQNSLKPFCLDNLKTLKQYGIKVEVYLGEYDSITDSNTALHSLLPHVSRIFLIKRQGHFLGMLES